jgi:hypothetical protein
MDYFDRADMHMYWNQVTGNDVSTRYIAHMGAEVIFDIARERMLA